MEEANSNALLNGALLGELNVVNQTFMHAQLLHHLRWAGPAEDAYEFAVAAMNRAMRLMLAMQADGQQIAFGPGPPFRDPSAINVQATPERMFEADRHQLAMMVDCYQGIVATGIWEAKTSVAVAGESLREIEDHIAALAAAQRSGPAADKEGRTELADLRKHSESYDDAWRRFGRSVASYGNVSGLETGWMGEVLTVLLRFLGQTFVHGFIHRHAGRRRLANLAFARSVDDMKVVYMLTNLALERAGAVDAWLPPPQLVTPSVKCENPKILASDKAGSRDLIALIDRSTPGAEADPIGDAILRDLRRAHEAFVHSLDAATQEDPTGSAGDVPDQIAAMLERWGIGAFPTGNARH